MATARLPDFPLIRTALERADIQLDGQRPWDIKVHDKRLFARILAHGSLGLGEAYMDGWWDCDALDAFFYRVLRAHISETLPINVKLIMNLLRFRLFNPQTLRGSRKVAKQHYDLGNDFYQAMLDPFMQYSCGYFVEASDDVAKAQERKLDLICRKLQLQGGDRVLDIGCGWGGFAKFAAERYGCHVTGVTISKEQAAFGKEFCKGLPVEIQLRDYRHVEETFDKIVSVGMFEHVGRKNYRTYMETARRCLKQDGLFLLHTIGASEEAGGYDPWIERYIFPNSILPAAPNITDATDGLCKLEDWHNFGASYDPTLMSWHQNFEDHWLQFKDRYGERFRRMWRYYLLSCAGAFRARSVQLWQAVLSAEGVVGGYGSVR